VALTIDPHSEDYAQGLRATVPHRDCANDRESLFCVDIGANAKAMSKTSVER
jgi:hypothetical protein